jgi:hypothetical protein
VCARKDETPVKAVWDNVASLSERETRQYGNCFMDVLWYLPQSGWRELVASGRKNGSVADEGGKAVCVWTGSIGVVVDLHHRASLCFCSFWPQTYLFHLCACMGGAVQLDRQDIRTTRWQSAGAWQPAWQK